jgi:hypothetical protein
MEPYRTIAQDETTGKPFDPRSAILAALFLVGLAVVLSLIFMEDGSGPRVEENWESGSAVPSLSLGEGYERYTNEALRFSLELARGTDVEVVSEEIGTTIVFTESDTERRFQIYVQPTENEADVVAAVTPERIREDLPNIVIEEPHYVLLNGGVEALLFYSRAESKGTRTRELWFAIGGLLYQVTARAEDDRWLAKLFSTWRFE